MNKLLSKPLLRAVTLLIVPFFLTGCSLGGGNSQNNTTNQPTLTIWRQKGATDTEENGFKAIIAAYKKVKGNENLNVVYRAFEPTEDYEKTVLNALAAGNGPDIWEIRDDELARHMDKLSPIELSTDTMVTYYKDNFAKVIADELIVDKKLYGFPLGLDPLVLYYNSDHFQAASITKPPKTWNEAIETANTLTTKANNQIIRPGLALGTGTNIDRAADILQLMMLQFNTQMVDPAHKTATFDLYVTDPETKKVSYPGRTALSLYASFAHPDSPYRSWDTSQPYSTLGFPQGKISMIINYLSLAPQFKALEKNLPFQITRVPQWITKKIPVGDLPAEVSDPVYFGHYDTLVVSKPSTRLTKTQQQTQTNRAWSFINFAIQPDNNVLFTNATGLLSPRITNNGTEGEAAANEIRRYMVSWYKSRSPRAVDQLFLDMIKAVTEQNQPVDQATSQAAQGVTNLLQ